MSELMKLNAEVGKVVVDDDGTEVCITTELINKAIAAKARLEMGVYITAMSLKEMRDNRLYLPLGYKSWVTFVENELPYNIRTVQKHLRIADNLFSLAGPYDPESKDNLATHASSLSQRTLLQLSNFSEEDRVRLVTEGFISLGDGDYSIDDLKRIAGKELTDKLKEYAPKIAKNAELERENDLLRTVNGAQKEKIEKTEARLKKLEAVAGSDRVGAILRDLRYHWHQMGALTKELRKLDPAVEATETVIELFKECIIDSNTVIESLQESIN